MVAEMYIFVRTGLPFWRYIFNCCHGGLPHRGTSGQAKAWNVVRSPFNKWLHCLTATVGFSVYSACYLRADYVSMRWLTEMQHVVELHFKRALCISNCCSWQWGHSSGCRQVEFFFLRQAHTVSSTLMAAYKDIFTYLKKKQPVHKWVSQCTIYLFIPLLGFCSLKFSGNNSCIYIINYH